MWNDLMNAVTIISLSVVSFFIVFVIVVCSFDLLRHLFGVGCLFKAIGLL